MNNVFPYKRQLIGNSYFPEREHSKLEVGGDEKKATVF
jgi:hypothetical protein